MSLSTFTSVYVQPNLVSTHAKQRNSKLLSTTQYALPERKTRGGPGLVRGWQAATYRRQPLKMSCASTSSDSPEADSNEPEEKFTPSFLKETDELEEGEVDLRNAKEFFVREETEFLDKAADNSAVRDAMDQIYAAKEAEEEVLGQAWDLLVQLGVKRPEDGPGSVKDMEAKEKDGEP
ncbi:hypothetical protein CYMTET_26142 [Cymbomonas tetramitiformis]|uniref:Uncharacterized protein n=1 Tax=Cymbomonas tetramitiformis TaxID=36881 RepID=A0AAE0FSN6_9CHLO|nr:hypothetical protein CYMTET_26142 [Cymbomonas tetramitiformis]